MSQAKYSQGTLGNMPGQIDQARNDSIGTGGSTADGQLSHRDPLEGVCNAQTGVTTKRTDAYSSNQMSNLVGSQENAGSSSNS
ncbi:unnamed protein product [Rotaria sp. Silwood1]|nr:unnamed protein product [Rotaria sp. Silwood1]CAF1028317.1 unnamed protein product [Rotaria sp. Silwood1]CAF4548323.1 unnamed protein product [Rotaria sp. Silwood1]